MRKLPPDERRVPFPGLTRATPNSASYLLSSYGRVYRIDRPRAGELDYSLTPCTPHPIADYLAVRLNGGRFTKSVPKAIAAAFSNLPKPRHDPDDRKKISGKSWRLRIDPLTPVDEETAQARCSIVDVEWIYCTTHFELCNTPGTIVPPHHVIPIWVPNPKEYPRYRDLNDYYKNLNTYYKRGAP